MKKLFYAMLFAAAVCCMGTANANYDRPSGNRITKTFDLRGFDGISSSAGIDVYITIGPEYEVKVTTDRKVMENVYIRVKGDVLHIGYDGKENFGNRDTKVYVTMPRVEELSASSGSDIETRGRISGNTLRISASSAAEIEASVDYKTVIIDCSSGADVDLEGEAEKCTADCSSGADIDVSDMRCTSVDASASSGGSIEVYATERLEADASSGGSIRYRGNPRNIDVDRSSGGSVRQMQN